MSSKEEYRPLSRQQLQERQQKPFNEPDSALGEAAAGSIS